MFPQNDIEADAYNTTMLPLTSTPPTRAPILPYVYRKVMEMSPGIWSILRLSESVETLDLLDNPLHSRTEVAVYLLQATYLSWIPDKSSTTR